MSKRKKIVLISILSIVALFLLFIGYHYVKYLQATSRMTELSADLDKRINEWEKKEYRRQPLFGPVVKGNAAEFYQEAESKLVDTSSDGWIEVSEAVSNPSRPISPEGKAYYEYNKPFIEIIRKGTRAETYKSPTDLRGGFECKIPNLLKMRMIGNLMAFQAREFDNAGQTSEAIKELCDIIQFGDDYLHYGTLIPAIIGIAISDISQEEMHRVVISGSLTETQLNGLMGHLEALIDSYPTMDDSRDGEIVAGEFGLKKLSEKSGFWFMPYEEVFTHQQNDFNGKIRFMFTYGWINRTDIINAGDDYRAFIGETKRINALPYPQAKVEKDKFDSTVKQLNNYVSRMMLQNISCGVISYFDILAVRKGVYILAALQIYKIRHGAYPEMLSALAPGIIPEVPVDPFSGQPFKYKLDKDGKIILYSVGENIKDDNGDRREDLLIAPYLRGNEPR